MRHGHDDLKVDPDESSSLTKLEVASHQQVEKTAGFAPRRRQAGVAAAQDLVAKSAAEQRVAAEKQCREFADKGSQGSECVTYDGLALQRRMKQRDEDVEQLPHLKDAGMKKLQGDSRQLMETMRMWILITIFSRLPVAFIV